MKLSAHAKRTYRLPAAAVTAAMPLILTGCATGSCAPPPSSPVANAGHVHGIAVDPISSKDLLATHDGLHDTTKTAMVKVSPSIELMGFTDTYGLAFFCACRHPGAGSELPNPVGL